MGRLLAVALLLAFGAWQLASVPADPNLVGPDFNRWFDALGGASLMAAMWVAVSWSRARA